MNEEKKGKVGKKEKVKSFTQISRELAQRFSFEINHCEEFIFKIGQNYSLENESKFLSNLNLKIRSLNDNLTQVFELLGDKEIQKLTKPTQNKILELQSELGLLQLKIKNRRTDLLVKKIDKTQDEIEKQWQKLKKITEKYEYFWKEILKNIILLKKIEKIIKRSQKHQIKIKILCTEEMEILIFDYNSFGKFYNFESFFIKYPELIDCDKFKT